MKNLNVKTFNATSSDLTLKDLVAFYNEHCHLLEKATVKKFATRAIAEKRVQEVLTTMPKLKLKLPNCIWRIIITVLNC